MIVGIILALLLFGLVVISHELGHFLLAKKNGIEVEEFSVGMGPCLISKQVGATKYCLRLLPLGGACMMGEDDVDSNSDGSFNKKSVWARISVIIAGPMFNFFLAFIFSVILVAWVGYDAPIIAKMTPGYPAQEAGIKAGDRIVKLNNKHINIYREVMMYNQFHQGKPVEVTYKRDGQTKQVTLIPRESADRKNYYVMGIEGGSYQKGNAFQSLQYGLYEVKYWICTTVESLKMLVTGKIGADNLSGPVGIVNMVNDTYQQSKPGGISVIIINLMNFAILLSANLGVMNLLPLPALDGGRLVFLVIEAVRGKRVPPEKEGMVHFAGMVLLFGLMIFVLFNDIKRIIM